ncbi:SWIM zinc finger family protein [Rhizobium bangladeshense]|uniref:SWIM zinc finger family protein n=1 Tax=Rhizobium bangladeshense TaxID=1138189 RepID=UPI0007E55BA6|nr:SWIM zinc finger family protein [Rhizobium bangladeshense]
MSGPRSENAARFDAAALGDALLEAASSKGLLRRARRDVEAGLVRLSGWEGGTALAEADGESVRLSAGPLSQASCSCPATGLCRHILAGILVIRDAGEGASADAPVTAGSELAPAAAAADAHAEILALGEDAIARAFGRAAYIKAQTLLSALEADAVRIETSANAVRIQLGDHPQVLYPAGGGPAGMISKAAASQRATLHAAALLAVRGPVESGAASGQALEEPEKLPSGVLEEAAALLCDAARQALSKAPAGLEERIGDLVLSSRAEAMPRLAGEFRTIAAMIRRRRERLDAADPAELLVMLARAYALTQALQAAPDAPLLFGAAGQAPQPLETIDLVGCGLRLWQSESGARGVTGYYLAADGRSFSATLARAPGSDPGFTPSHAATGETVFGRSLAAIAGSAFRLEGAAVSGDGRLHTGSGRAELLEAGWEAATARIDGVVIDDWSQCATRLARAFRPKLAAPPRRAEPLILRPARFGPLRFDGVAQVGRWPVQDGEGRWLELEIEGDDRLEANFALLGTISARQPSLLSVLAVARGAEIVLSPVGFGADRLTMLDLPPPPSAAITQRPSLLSRLTKSLTLSGLAERRPAGEGRFEAMARPQAASLRLVSAAFDEILALAELGGRMEDPERLQRMEALGRKLDEAGLALAGALLVKLAAAPGRSRADHLLRAAYALDLMTRIDPGLPLVRML